MFQLDHHVGEECPKTKMTCEYEDIGCTHRVSAILKLQIHLKNWTVLSYWVVEVSVIVSVVQPRKATQTPQKWADQSRKNALWRRHGPEKRITGIQSLA